MNTYLRLGVALFTLLSLSTYSQEHRQGGVSGGGGNAVVCKKGGVITSVELLDLYEDRNGEKINYRDLTGDMNSDMTKLTGELYPDARTNEYTNVLAADYISIIWNLKSLSQDDTLAPTEDVLSIIKPKDPDCNIIPVINFNSRDNIIIDRELFDKMDYMNQLALMLHEVLYLKEREQGVTDSRYVRKIVGRAFRKTMMESLQYSLYEVATQKCEILNERRETIFYITQKREYYLHEVGAINTIFFEKLNGHNLILFTGFDYQLPEDKSDFSIKNPFMYKYVKTPLDLELTKLNGKMYLSFDGGRDDNFYKREVTCTPFKN